MQAVMSHQERVTLMHFGIDPTKVPLIEGKPWLTSEQLATIARQSGEFSLIEVDFKEYVEKLNQIIWIATLTDTAGRTYSRSGVATIGEKLPNGDHPDVNELAASRALRSTLAMAGFDLFKPGPVVVVHLDEEAKKRLETYRPIVTEVRPSIEYAEIRERADETATRNSNIRQLHAIAEEVGLIVRRTGQSPDYSAYRTFLQESFDATTCVNFTEQQFTQAINMIRCLMHSEAK